MSFFSEGLLMVLFLISVSHLLLVFRYMIDFCVLIFYFEKLKTHILIFLLLNLMGYFYFFMYTTMTSADRDAFLSFFLI